MPGADILDVVIGLSFIFLVLSLICTSLGELASRFFALRSQNLEQAIRNLIEGDATSPSGSFQDFYHHPLITRLGIQSRGMFILRRLPYWKRRRGKPSYIEPRTFALAFLDVVAPSGDSPRRLTDIRAEINKLNPDLKRSLLPLIDSAEGSLANARENIEQWFDDAMARAAGWYRRKMQVIVLALALIVTVSFNADTLEIINSLWSDAELRQTLSHIAISTAERTTDPNEIGSQINLYEAQLSEFNLIGWTELPVKSQEWLVKIIGLAATTVSISFGAPFWFDLLGKLVSLRGSGSRPLTGPERRPSTRQRTGT